MLLRCSKGKENAVVRNNRKLPNADRGWARGNRACAIGFADGNGAVDGKCVLGKTRRNAHNRHDFIGDE